MTKVYISHNPFEVSTEIEVGGEPIAQTSSLYRYRNTPMQDWVGTFLPDLIEQCNDDELVITFHGLQFNFDDLEAEVDGFMKKNREYDIELEHESSKSQNARMGAIELLYDEMNSQDVVEELKDYDFRSKIAMEPQGFRIYTIAENETWAPEFTKELHGEIMGCMDNLKIEFNDMGNLHKQNNETYRICKNAVDDDDKPVVVYMLDKKSNDFKMLNLISEQYTLKGKQNKKRFIFVAENPMQARKMLNSDYTMRNTTVYAVDDVENVSTAITEYMQENTLISVIKEHAKKLGDNLAELSSELKVSADRSKDISEIDKLEAEAIRLCEKIKLSGMDLNYKHKVQEQMSAADRLVKSCIELFESSDIFPRASLGVFLTVGPRVGDAKSNISHFVHNTLEKHIKAELKKIEKESNAALSFTISVDDDISKLLKKLGCTNSERNLSNLSLGRNENTVYLRGALGIISNLKITYETGMGIFGIGSSTTVHEYGFYEGLEKIISREIYGDGYVEHEKINNCQKVFREQIGKIKPVIRQKIYAQLSKSSTYISKYSATVEQCKKEMLSEIKTNASNLRKGATISEKDKEKLAYIQQLQAKVEQLTVL